MKNQTTAKITAEFDDGKVYQMTIVVKKNKKRSWKETEKAIAQAGGLAAMVETIKQVYLQEKKEEKNK